MMRLSVNTQAGHGYASHDLWLVLSQAAYTRPVSEQGIGEQQIGLLSLGITY